MSSSFRAPPAPSPEDMNLVILCRAIWQQKKLILAMTMLLSIISFAYAMLATPEYQVTSVLRAAAINELDELNRSEIYKLPPAEALTKVGAALESYDVRLGFFRENQRLFKAFEQPGRTLEQSFEAFNRDSIKLTMPDKKSDSRNFYIKLEMNYPEGVDGVTILNRLVEYTISSEQKQIAADLKVIVRNRLSELKGKLDAARANYDTEKEAKIAMLSEMDSLKRMQLEDELKALRAQLKNTRLDRVAQLNEAIEIARSLGIKRPATPSSFGGGDQVGSANVMRTEINNQQVPLYFMGVDALEAERVALMRRRSDDFVESRIAQIAKELQLLQANRQIEVLKLRQNEDLFLSGVEPIRAESARLRNLNLDMSHLKLVAIDRQALDPLKPIKPKKSLIVVLGIMLGLLLGVLVAVFRHMFFFTSRITRNDELRLSAEKSARVVSGKAAPLVSPKY
ncbi:GNVR domain-containing protein [Pseudomonas extremorientalis]|uniref:GNVR domain-containing protein n=1 Tax=Pseudomonas extremorientalis TaxID=169669 RepID=UPI00211C238F|nr:GNVR domain-containing protein [Pseudomonas extremorientalis]UUN90437.1 Wzz/FepE/Etk N-terminal domain-containing protein [Pseudomonas extremorientalis]